MIVMYDEMNATINVYVVGDLVSDPPRDKPTSTVGYALNINGMSWPVASDWTTERDLK